MLSAKCQMPSARSCLRLSVLFALCIAFNAPAFAREWRITRFASSVAVAQDGTMTVHEHLVVAFDGEYHGIYRDIPIEYPGPHGSNYELFLKVTGVTNALGQKLKYDSSVQNGYRHLKIYIPNATNTTQNVEIYYTVQNGVRWFDGF